MKAKELIKILEQYPNHDVRLMYTDYRDCSYDYPLPKYVEMEVYGVDDKITTQTLKTVYLAYAEI